MNLQQYKERYYAGNDRMNPVLESKIKSKSTIVSNNPAFPTSDASGNEYNFEELIAYKRFLDCVERVKRYSGMNDVSSQQSFMMLQQKMFQALMQVKQIEAPHKEYLEKLGVKLVIDEMELPSNAFNFDAKIVDIGSVKSDKFQSTSKEPSQNEIQNAFGEKAMEEFMSANQYFQLEKDKRRFINMLIQGSSKKGHYMFELIREDLNKIHPELANYYGLIMAVNDYSYWVISESYLEQNFDNQQSMAGKEEIDNSEDVPKIKTQGINFPVLVHENIKGVMEIFGTHGLPDDVNEQQMIMDSTDTLYNEIWDIRLGVVVWEKFISSYPFEVFEVGNRNIQHYMFMRICQLPADEFFDVARSVLSDSPKGKKFMEDLAKDIIQDMKKSSLEDVFGSDDDYNDYDEYKKGGSVLLAPNGKPSNLTPEQYKLVRTPEFKAWFGDWENDPANASKVVDSNGEPLVVYHGSRSRVKFAFSEFNVPQEGVYFSSDYTTATWFSSGYDYKLQFEEIELPKTLNENSSIEDLENYYKTNIDPTAYTEINTFNDGTIMYRLYTYNESVSSPLGQNLKDAKARLFKEIQYAIESINNKSRYPFYNVFLNIRNPYKIDAKGNTFDETPFENGNYSAVSVTSEIKSRGKNDGVIIKNTIETTELNRKSNSYIVFNSNQIKLADGTNTTFDGNNPDIRFEGGGNVSKYKDYKIEIEEIPAISQIHATITQNGNQIGFISLDDFPNNPYVSYSGIDKEHSGKGLGSYVYDLLDDYSFNKTGKHITHGDINSSISAIRLWRKRLKNPNYLPDGFYSYWGDEADEVLKYLNNPDIRFKKGGSVNKSKNDDYDVYDNSRMIKNQANEIEHHSEELNKQVSKTRKIPSWVIAKMERATTDLSDVTHYLDGEKKFEYGGNISDEIDYLDRRINSLEEQLIVINDEDKPRLQQTISQLEDEKNYLIKKSNKEEGVGTEKRFWFFKNGGNVGHLKYDVVPYPKSDKYVIMTNVYDDGRDALVKDFIRDFKGNPLKFDTIKSAEKYTENIKLKHPFGMMPKAKYGAILVASQLFQNRQNQKPETQYVYYIPKSEEYQETEIVQEIPQMRTGGELSQKDLNDLCVTEIIELSNDIQEVSYYKTIRHDSNDSELKKWNGKLVIVFKDDIEQRTLNGINDFILRAEPCQDIFDQTVHYSEDRPKLIYIYFRTNSYTDIEYKFGGKVYENTPKKINLSKTDMITTSLGDYVLYLVTEDFVYFVNKYEGDENAQVIMYNKKGELVSDNYFATSEMYENLESGDEFEYIHPDLIEYKNEFN